MRSSGTLALYPDDAKQDPMVYGAEFGVAFMAKGPRTVSLFTGRGSRLPRPLFTIRVLRESATFDWP